MAIDTNELLVIKANDEKVKIKTETDHSHEVLGRNSNDEFTSKLLGGDINIKVELKSDDNSIDNIETAGDLTRNYSTVEPRNHISGDQVALQYLDFVNAYKSETVMKQENCHEYGNNNLQEELSSRKVGDDLPKGSSREKQISPDKCDNPLGIFSKPHSCDTCGKSFAQKCNLKTHKRSHTGEKPYSCNACGKAFGRKSILKEHENIHTCEKSYSCGICKKIFNQKSNFKKHLKRIHNESFIPSNGIKRNKAIIPSTFTKASSEANNSSFSINRKLCEDRGINKLCKDRGINNLTHSQDSFANTEVVVCRSNLISKKLTSVLKPVQIRFHDHQNSTKAQYAKTNVFLTKSVSLTIPIENESYHSHQSHVKEEFSDDNCQYNQAPIEFKQLMCDKVVSDIDTALKTEVVVKEESFCWDEHNQQALM